MAALNLVELVGNRVELSLNEALLRGERFEIRSAAAVLEQLLRVLEGLRERFNLLLTQFLLNLCGMIG